MTPAECRGKVAAVQRDRRKWSLHMAWHAERFQREKRLKPLAEYHGEERFRPKQKQTARDMMATLKQMAKTQKRRHERQMTKQTTEQVDG